MLTNQSVTNCWKLRQLNFAAIVGMPSIQISPISFVQTPARGFAYHKNVLDHYENPRNIGSLDKKDPNVGTGLVGAPACGDVMKL